MPIFIPKDRKSLFRQFLSGMYDAVVITDPNGYIIEINERATEYFGLTIEAARDQQISLLIPGLRQEVVARIRRGMEEDRHVVIDANGRTADGKTIACEVAVSMIDLLNLGDLIFTIRNVERRRAYLQTSRAKANAFDLAQSALFVCGQDGRILEANAAFINLFDLKDVEEARQHFFADFMSDEPLPERFTDACEGKSSTTGIVAKGDGEDEEEIEIVLGPNRLANKIAGVVGSIHKV